jgi:hypothetical protein
VVGALLGSLYANGFTYFLGRNPLIQNIVPLLPLVLLYVSPAGLIALVTSVRDSFLRIIAQRRQIVVPSLFADYDPEALARRLIPLSESSGGFGLAALPGIRRFTLTSELYHGHGERIIAKLAPKRATNEAAAIAAAARTAE